MLEITRANLQRAIARAKQVRPHVTWLGGRNFAVTGSTGNEYAVSFVVVDGRKLASCGCKAHRRGLPCFHVAAAAAVNVMIQSRKGN